MEAVEKPVEIFRGSLKLKPATRPIVFKFVLSNISPTLRKGTIKFYGKDQQGEFLNNYYDDFSVDGGEDDDDGK